MIPSIVKLLLSAPPATAPCPDAAVWAAAIKAAYPCG